MLESVKDFDDDIKKSVKENLILYALKKCLYLKSLLVIFKPYGYDAVIFDTDPTGHTLRLLVLLSYWKGFIKKGKK
ncbi:MAG: hypothetical protein NTV16_00360 [Actinobacteria bacterium]|nr:hypothetical protein [Actinomycetota bacterium]